MIKSDGKLVTFLGKSNYNSNNNASSAVFVFASGFQAKGLLYSYSRTANLVYMWSACRTAGYLSLISRAVDKISRHKFNKEVATLQMNTFSSTSYSTSHDRLAAKGIYEDPLHTWADDAAHNYNMDLKSKCTGCTQMSRFTRKNCHKRFCNDSPRCI